MRGVLVACVLLAGCDVTRGGGGGDRGADRVGTPTSAGGTSPPQPTGGTPTSAPLTDAERVQALIAGELGPAEVVPAVVWSGGFPVHDGDRLWFIHWYEGGDWALAGDHNDWVPEPMIAGNGFWYAEVPIAGDVAGWGYKFVDGDRWIADPFARSYTYDTFGELSYTEPPSDRARFDRWSGVAAEGLAPRDLRVYVPPGDGPFDVLYAHDGQNLFDPNALWGGWRLHEAAGDVLVVGIDNTPDRFAEYTHVDDTLYGETIEARGDAYAALIGDVIRPHIEATYGSTGHDGVIGSSLGGLISLHVAWAQPGEWDFVASLSGTLGWGRYGLEHEAMEARWVADRPELVVYVDSGGDAGGDGRCTDADGDGYPEDDADDSDNYCVTRQFADALAGAGYTWDTTLFHWHEPGAPHNEAAWAARVWRPIEQFRAAR